MGKWKGREAGDRSRHREKQRKGDPEAQEKQGKLGIPAPQIHPEWPIEPSLPISVSGSCLSNPCILTVNPNKFQLIPIGSLCNQIIPKTV